MTLTSTSTSKLYYSYNMSIGNLKFNVSDAIRQLFSQLFNGSKHGSSYDLRGNENWLELAGVQVIKSSSYRGFELPRVKLQWIYEGNPGKIDFGLS